MSIESKVILSAENETETESESYQDPKQYTAERKLISRQYLVLPETLLI